ncbi:MAG: insulinase family protein [Tepidisphaeraceae bacterium]|jgi:hypothetical protein
MTPGEIIDGFLVRRVTPLPNLRSTAIELLHQVSGARMLHLSNSDAENLFSICFPTPPPDDTGVPHILEHSVLAGSDKYQVKDPFFEMLKSSMATFINAMTGSDYTVYPVASNVRQDFFNLAEVYWDAVFHPLLTEQTFQREGHHLEFDKDGHLIIKGIVYNEMKGALSNPQTKVYDLIEKNLWPDTPLGKNAGGDPDHIPQLTWHGLRRFHQFHYHPSNAFIFLYGDIPTADHLSFLRDRLSGFTRRDLPPHLPPQPRWTGPRKLSDAYPVAPTDQTAAKTFIILSWLVGSATDVPELFAFSALDRILLGNQAAPLRKALIDAKLGEDLSHSGFWANGQESTFNVGLKGSEPQRGADVETLVLHFLDQFARHAVPREQFDAAIQQLMYHHLEITPTYPLHLMGAAISLWPHGGDPLALFLADQHLRQLQRDFAQNPQLFGELIRRKLLDNPHRLTLIVQPDPQLQARSDAEFAEKMRKLQASLSPDQLQHIAANQEALDAALAAPNSPQALATLPQLRVADLPPKPRHIPTTVETLPGGATLLVNDVFANGVNYLIVAFDLTGLPAHLYPYLPLYGACVQKMGAAGQDYVHVAQRIAAYTGGVSFTTAFSTRVDDPQRLLRHGIFGIKFLDDNAERALAVLRDLMFALDPRDSSRLQDVLLQSRAQQRMRPTHDGMGLALRHAARGFNPEAHLNQITGGLPQIQFMEKITADNVAPTIESLDAIRSFLLNRARVAASFTGSAKVLDLLRRNLTDWTAAMSDAPIADLPLGFSPFSTPPRQGLAAPMNVAYCTAAMPAPHISHADAPLLAVAARLLSLNYVLDEVRFKGSAYGGGCGYNGNSQLWSFHSYRDPWIVRTLDVYAAALGHVRNADWTQADVDRSIIGTAKEGERPIRPTQAGGIALGRYLTGDTPQRREARHSAMLAATLPHIRRVLIEQFESHASQTAVCVVSSREKLEEANRQRPQSALEIEDILPPLSGN